MKLLVWLRSWLFEKEINKSSRTELSSISLVEANIDEGSAKYKMSITFEQKGHDKPVCVAEFLAVAYEWQYYNFKIDFFFIFHTSF